MFTLMEDNTYKCCTGKYIFSIFMMLQLIYRMDETSRFDTVKTFVPQEHSRNRLFSTGFPARYS
jgi:hypothetical protein